MSEADPGILPLSADVKPRAFVDSVPVPLFPWRC